MFFIHRRYLLFAFLALLFTVSQIRGQDGSPRGAQFWFDYDPTWRLSERLTLDVDTGARVINSSPSLWQIRLQSTLDYSPWKWMDLTGGVWLIYSNQSETFDRFETRPIVGIKFKKDIWRGVRVSHYARMEFRIQRNLETGETESARRLRNRAQAMIPINRRSLFEDNTWITFADVEFFRQRNPNVDDGFNSRRRYRVGIAWRRNSAWTYQFFYGFQRSRENIKVPFSVDDIFSFNFIHTFK